MKNEDREEERIGRYMAGVLDLPIFRGGGWMKKN